MVRSNELVVTVTRTVAVFACAGAALLAEGCIEQPEMTDTPEGSPVASRDTGPEAMPADSTPELPVDDHQTESPQVPECKKEFDKKQKREDKAKGTSRNVTYMRAHIRRCKKWLDQIEKDFANGLLGAPVDYDGVQRRLAAIESHRKTYLEIDAHHDGDRMFSGLHYTSQELEGAIWAIVSETQEHKYRKRCDKAEQLLKECYGHLLSSSRGGNPNVK